MLISEFFLKFEIIKLLAISAVRQNSLKKFKKIQRFFFLKNKKFKKKCFSKRKKTLKPQRGKGIG